MMYVTKGCQNGVKRVCGKREWLGRAKEGSEIYNYLRAGVWGFEYIQAFP